MIHALIRRARELLFVSRRGREKASRVCVFKTKRFARFFFFFFFSYTAFHFFLILFLQQARGAGFLVDFSENRCRFRAKKLYAVTRSLFGPVRTRVYIYL